jgi:hypothetical protein
MAVNNSIKVGPLVFLLQIFVITENGSIFFYRARKPWCVMTLKFSCDKSEGHGTDAKGHCVEVYIPGL